MLKFQYARESFGYLIKTFDIKEIWLPYYLCDVMRHTAVLAGCKPLFYHIDDNFMPAIEFPKDDFILYPNYFGVCDKNVTRLADTHSNLIVDNAHSFYSEPIGFACFNSERKFHPDKVNSYLWIKKNGVPALKSKALLENTKIIGNFKEYEKKYRDENLLKFDIESISSPFCYPCLLSTDKEADLLAEKLEKEGKTIYRYWNNLPKSFNEYKFYRRLVPIPLD